MGRHKTRHKHLPPRMRLIRGRYYYIGCVVTAGKVSRPCTPLGNDYVRALLKYREIQNEDTDPQTISALLDWHASKDNLSPITQAGYRRNAVALKRYFQGMRPEDVLTRHIAAYLHKRSAKVAGSREIALLSAAWNAARTAGKLDLPNPCIGVERPQARKRKTTASPEQEGALTRGRGAIPVMVELASLTGLRQADIRLMRMSQLTDDGIDVTPSKTAGSTEARVLFEWTKALRACIARAKLLRRKPSCEWLFPTRSGEPYSLNGFQTMWKRHMKRANVSGLTFHDVRRTSINAVKKERGKEAAQEFAAHASITTTERYLTNVGVVRIRPRK